MPTFDPLFSKLFNIARKVSFKSPLLLDANAISPNLGLTFKYLQMAITSVLWSKFDIDTKLPKC